MDGVGRRILIIAALMILIPACVAVNDRKGDRSEIASINVNLAQNYYSKGLYEFSKEKLDKALRLDPENLAANSLLALVYDQLGKKSEAQEQYEFTLDLAEQNSVESAEVNNNYAIFLCQNGNWSDAEAHFKEALAVDAYQTRDAALENAAFCALKAQDFPKAELYFNSALSENSNLSRSLLGLAKVKSYIGDWLSVKTTLETFHQQNKPVEESLYLAVQAEKNLKNKVLELEYMERFKALFPDSALLQK